MMRPMLQRKLDRQREEKNEDNAIANWGHEGCPEKGGTVSAAGAKERRKGETQRKHRKTRPSATTTGGGAADTDSKGKVKDSPGHPLLVLKGLR